MSQSDRLERLIKEFERVGVDPNAANVKTLPRDEKSVFIRSIRTYNELLDHGYITP